MELIKHKNGYENGLGELVQLESNYLFPMLKSSDLANGKILQRHKYMLVPQSATGEETDTIEYTAPLTWAYLQRHSYKLEQRGSSIYKKRPRFSVFGIGEYSFAPWKLAISGFYKSLHFRVIGSIDNKPVVLDDTANFIPCQTQDEAECLLKLFSSDTVKEFYESFIFWDSKRPVTIDLLRKLDIKQLAKQSGKSSHLRRLMDSMQNKKPISQSTVNQYTLF